MLEELLIHNYALIDELKLSFDGGLNILTGETGAGKSIIVGALSFILGAKVDTDIIRTGSDETSVSAVLSFSPQNIEVLQWLELRSIPIEDGKIILRRTLKQNGRGSTYIQNVPVTRSDLQEFTELLFDIHGQHEHQALLKKEMHRRYLDRYAGIEDTVLQFNQLFLKLTDKRKEMEVSVEAERGRAARMELLAYSIEEIQKVNPKIGETAELEAESRRLGDFEKLSELIHTATEQLFEFEGSSLTTLRKVRAALESAKNIDPGLQEIEKRVEQGYYELEDIADELRSYRDGLHFDPQRLETIEERLVLLYRLKKKYGEDEQAILVYKQKAEQELDMLQHVEEDREKLKGEIVQLERELIQQAGIISAKRSAASKKLSDEITAILATLGMTKVQFIVSVHPKSQEQGNMVCGPYGSDEVEFFISPNVGEPLKELAKIASGGELSRIMLAIKTILANIDTIETLVFDEIDTGIGGEVALAVGEHLTKIGKLKQIFCITHLASIAVRADNHLKVEKQIEGDRTVTTVRTLAPNELREEIARMLAGDSAGSAALAHADELLSRYGSRG